MGLGIKILIIVLLVAGVATAAYAVVSKYNTAIEEAEKNKALADKFAGERDGWIDVVVQEEAAKTKANEALKSREVARARLQEERDRARAELSKLRDKQENVAWLDQPLPTDVVAWLRLHTGKQAASESGGKPAAPKPAVGLPGAAVRGQPERGSAVIR